MTSATWTFGLRELPDADDGRPVTFAFFFTEEGLAAEASFDAPPTDPDLGALYAEAIEATGLVPKRVLVEDGPTAKRVRPLFVKGARVEIAKDAGRAIDEAFERVLGQAIASELFAELPDAWKDELTSLGEALAEHEPWARVPTHLVRASVPSLGVTDVHVLLVEGATTGFLVFESAADLERFRQVAMAKGAADTSTLPRAIGVELVQILRPTSEVLRPTSEMTPGSTPAEPPSEESLALVANVDVRTSEGLESASEADVRLAATLSRLLLAYTAEEPTTAPRELEVSVRGERVRGTLTVATLAS